MMGCVYVVVRLADKAKKSAGDTVTGCVYVGEYGLTLHPTKTRMIDFRHPGRRRGEDDGRPGSFNLLGFTHYWAKSRRDNWVVKQKTAKKRLSRAIKATYEWCKAHRHAPLQWQHRQLCRKLRGHYNYYRLTGNHDALARYHREVRSAWYKWLARRSQPHSKGRLTWEQYARLLKRYPLTPPVAVHSTLRRSANP